MLPFYKLIQCYSLISPYYLYLPVSSFGSAFITIADISGVFLEAFTDTGLQSSLLEQETE